MQPPSSRTGACRTHHHRVATTPEGTECCTTNGLAGLDIARTLQYCCVSYVRAHIASSDFPRLKSCLKFRKAASASIFEAFSLREAVATSLEKRWIRSEQGETHGPPRRQIRHHHRRGQRHRTRGIAIVHQGRRQTDRGRPRRRGEGHGRASAQGRRHGG